ncbi:MAG: FAD-binding and (Fe-S)-binding domain-containing protein [Bacteroidota bacterium]|nr:FAD-binding and (Fe-S)-binding domain-containing protein [Bacteroidota bacterium]
MNQDYLNLERDLRRHITGEVRFDRGSRAIYAEDASNYRQMPIGLVIPRTTEDVIAAVAIAREHGAPILSRGAGTSIAGQCVNAAVVLDFSKYLNQVIEIDPVRRLARVQPGCVLDNLRSAAEKHHLTFGPDPATHKYCTLGGMIGNNSCGVHSIMAGRTVDNVHSLNVLLYDGTHLVVGKSIDSIDSVESTRAKEIYRRLQTLAETYSAEIHARFPDIPRRVSGYSIDQLLPENGFHVARSLVGSEGTLVTTLEAMVQLVPSPPSRVLLVAGYDDMAAAGDRVPLVLDHRPIGFEGMDRRLTNAMQKKGLHTNSLPLLPSGDAWLLIEFGAETVDAARDAAERCQKSLKHEGAMVEARIFDSVQDQKAVWSVRDSALGAISRTPGEKDNWEGWEDAAVPPAKIGGYLREFRALMDRFDYSGALYGHIGDGCLHNRIDWDPKSQEGIAKWLRFVDEAADLVLSYGGSLSGEHGDGQARGALLPKMFGPRLMQAFEDFKTIWDPDWKMNPGKLIRPFGIYENLKFGAHYSPPIIQTHFAFADDDGSFARATERCVGAGVCRKEHDGVMCPSYRATRDEQHVTRGRAHLLWEMLHGEVITDGFKSSEVREALDLCLSCKGCTGECPVRVDMPTYKAEFLSHYYKGRLRPRAAYAMGLIYWGARIASRMPSLVNALTHAPITSTIAKKLAGIHPKRAIPRFANETFKHWYSRLLPEGHSTPPSVILWADTFNNYFRPETAIAAVKVLEDAGFGVKVYKQTMCCGRPLYDWGMLDLAKKQLLDILSIVSVDVAAGMPIVVLEPSCASVFRDEARKLFPQREDAKHLAESTYLLSEFLAKYAPDYRSGAISESAPNHIKSHREGGETPPLQSGILHLHCHHHSILDREAEGSVLKRAGIDAEQLDAGCCGMAGAFGFETEHYELSMQIGERKVLPKVRETSGDQFIIADGFSCREQIQQATGRKTMHLAEVLASNVAEQIRSSEQ